MNPEQFEKYYLNARPPSLGHHLTAHNDNEYEEIENRQEQLKVGDVAFSPIRKGKNLIKRKIDDIRKKSNEKKETRSEPKDSK